MPRQPFPLLFDMLVNECLLEPWSVFTFILGGQERTGVIPLVSQTQDTSSWLGFRKLFETHNVCKSVCSPGHP